MADISRLTPDEPADAEALSMAREIIALHHDHLAHAAIAWMWHSTGNPEKPWASKGRVIFGKARKATAFESAINGEPLDFVIELNWDIWGRLPPEKQRALIDHELSHCGFELDEDGAVNYTMRPHDIEEFSGVLARHGAWTVDLEQMIEVTRQLELFGPGDTHVDATPACVANIADARSRAGAH